MNYSFRTIAIITFATLWFPPAAQAQRKYERLGIAFNIPEGWEVIEEKKGGDSAIAFTCHDLRTGYSGTAIFFYSDNSKSPDEILKMNMEDMIRSDHSNNKPAHNFSTITDTTVSIFNARITTYSWPYDEDFYISGSLVSFKACGKTALITLQGASIQDEKNREGYRTILGSLSCK